MQSLLDRQQIKNSHNATLSEICNFGLKQCSLVKKMCANMMLIQTNEILTVNVSMTIS